MTQKQEEPETGATYNPIIEQVNGLTWRVQSQSKSETFYVVRIYANGVECNCKGFVFRAYCKHVNLVKAKIADQEQAKRMKDFQRSLTTQSTIKPGYLAE